MGKHGLCASKRAVLKISTDHTSADRYFMVRDRILHSLASGNKKSLRPQGTKASCIHPISTACRHAELKKYSDFSCILQRCNGRTRRTYLSALPAQERTFYTGPALLFTAAELSEAGLRMYSFPSLPYREISLLLPFDCAYSTIASCGRQGVISSQICFYLWAKDDWIKKRNDQAKASFQEERIREKGKKVGPAFLASRGKE